MKQLAPARLIYTHRLDSAELRLAKAVRVQGGARDELASREADAHRHKQRIDTARAEWSRGLVGRFLAHADFDRQRHEMGVLARTLQELRTRVKTATESYERATSDVVVHTSARKSAWRKKEKVAVAEGMWRTVEEQAQLSSTDDEIDELASAKAFRGGRP
ncbi:hypothetical protein [Variovorax saccharolyticus]|uniref:hypothetical protein n=1 Tax=Variovorax saccharolyticus TaxID=3053516 RepID=UPI00257673DC|nr:hypothetical protein [Variovorax sp. J31P216]MDM0030170.1 hypothetical protein [Variovorax sp. J31P216]